MEDWLVLEYLQAGVGRRARQRIPRVGMPVIKSVPAVFASKRTFDAVRAERDTQRQKAPSDPLRKAHQVRHDSRQIASEHFPGAAKSRENFIGDKQYVVARAEPANFLQEFNRMNDHPAGALKQWLNDDCCNFVCAIRQEHFQLPGAFDVAGFTPQADRTPIAISRMYTM